MSQIVKKFIGEDQVDANKILLENNTYLKQKKSDSTTIQLFGLNSFDEFILFQSLIPSGSINLGSGGTPFNTIHLKGFEIHTDAGESLTFSHYQDETVNVFFFASSGVGSDPNESSPVLGFRTNESKGTGNTGNIAFSTAQPLGSGLRGKVQFDARAVQFPMSGSDPVSPQAGDVYYNTVVNKLKFYNGSAWETVTSA